MRSKESPLYEFRHQGQGISVWDDNNLFLSNIVNPKGMTIRGISRNWNGEDGQLRLEDIITVLYIYAQNVEEETACISIHLMIVWVERPSMPLTAPLRMAACIKAALGIFFLHLKNDTRLQHSVHIVESLKLDNSHRKRKPSGHKFLSL